MFKFSKKSLDVLSTVDARLQALVYSVLSDSKYNFGIPSTGGLRTVEEQKALFDKGWSKCDGVIKKSYHQSGKAIDIVIYDEHGLCYNCVDKYEDIAALFYRKFAVLHHVGVFPKDSYIRWGGDWNSNGIRVDKDETENFMDIPHFEIKNL